MVDKRLRMINGKTQLVCLLGSPVEHSFSPMMHNASFQKLDINASYMAFDVKKASLKQAVEGLRNLRFVGGNVTIPHKVDIMQYLDEIDPKAALIGACNTIVLKDDRLCGYNTDVDGFIESFKSLNFDFRKKRIAVLGTGGASKAVVVGFLYENVEEIHLFSRQEEKSKTLASSFGSDKVVGRSYESLEKNYPYDVIVNTTPVGMHPHEGVSVIDASLYGHDQTIFYDLIYNPTETEFLRQARLSGKPTMNGLDMLIYQGIYALRYWFDFDSSLWTKDDVMDVLKTRRII